MTRTTTDKLTQVPTCRVVPAELQGSAPLGQAGKLRILAAVACITLAAGCGGGSSDSGTAAPATTSTTNTGSGSTTSTGTTGTVTTPGTTGTVTTPGSTGTVTTPGTTGTVTTPDTTGTVTTPGTTGTVTIPGTTGTVTTLAGSGSSGNVNGTGSAASFNGPAALASDASGNIYVADLNNNVIRKISAAGVVTTLAGSGSSGYANGVGTAASFSFPSSVAVDGAGNVYVADAFNQRIRKISATGVVSTFAGSGNSGKTDGNGAAASFNGPIGVAVDNAGNVYVADASNNLIRKISPSGQVSTLAGSGAYGSTDGNALSAAFIAPRSLVVDAAGNVYVSEPVTNRVRKISTTGMVSTVAGTGAVGSANGVGTAASLADPIGLAVDGAGNVYVTTVADDLVRKISTAGVVTTFAGTGKMGNTNGALASATFNMPEGITIDSAGNIYIADFANNLIRKISP